MLPLDNDLRHFIMQQNHVCFRRFSVRDISCKQKVIVEVKLIYFLIGFVLGLDFSCLDIGLA